MAPLRRSVRPRRVQPFHAHLGAVGMANLADGVMQTGIGLLALTLTRSPLAMGVLSAAVWLPWLLFGLSAGRGVDRWDRRSIMIVGLTVRAISLLTVAALAMAGHLTILVLVILALSYGITEVFVDLAAQAQVPALTGRSATELQRANARLLAIEQITNGFVGPPLAGLLVGLGAGWFLAMPSIAVLGAVLVLVIGLRHWRAPAMQSTPENDATNHRNSGLRILWCHPVLRPLIFCGALWNAGSTAMGAVLLLWMVGPGSAGAMNPQTWGLVVTALPAGAVLGSWLVSSLLQRVPEITALLSCWAVGAAALAIPLISPNVAGMVTYGLIAGMAGVIGNVVSGSIRPRMIPDAQLGRVGGAARFVGFGIMPLSALAAGQLATLAGIPAVIIAAAATAGLATLMAGATVNQKLINAHELT